MVFYIGLTRVCIPKQDGVANPEIVYFRQTKATKQKMDQNFQLYRTKSLIFNHSHHVLSFFLADFYYKAKEF